MYLSFFYESEIGGRGGVGEEEEEEKRKRRGGRREGRKSGSGEHNADRCIWLGMY